MYVEGKVIVIKHVYLKKKTLKQAAVTEKRRNRSVATENKNPLRGIKKLLGTSRRIIAVINFIGLKLSCERPRPVTSPPRGQRWGY